MLKMAIFLKSWDFLEGNIGGCLIFSYFFIRLGNWLVYRLVTWFSLGRLIGHKAEASYLLRPLVFHSNKYHIVSGKRLMSMNSTYSCRNFSMRRG